MPNNTTRRTFLKGATAAAVLPTIVPSSVFGKNAPSNRVNMGMIAVGGQGSSHTKKWVNHPQVQVVGVSDAFQSRITRAIATTKKQSGGPAKGYRDFLDMLDRADIDAVTINSQDVWHVPMAIHAARQGKHVYVNKPLSVSLNYAQAMRDTIHATGVKFQFGTQQRCMKQFVRAVELVRNGYIGKVHRVEAWSPDMTDDFTDFHGKPFGSTKPAPIPADLDYDKWVGPGENIPYTADRCTRQGAFHRYDVAMGFIAGWGIHPLDIAIWGLDKDKTGDGPTTIRPRGGLLPSKGLFDTVYAWDVDLKYADGVEMRFSADKQAMSYVRKYHKRPSNHGTTFFGDEGWISVDRKGIYYSNPKLAAVALKPSDTRLGPVGTDQWDDFIQCILQDRETISPVEVAVRGDTICYLSDAAIRSGKTLKWDPVKETVIGNPAAQRLMLRTPRAPYTF
ncbi:MAG: Gfo/Idh/MocA family oxidoreductase [Phycisphaerales bacterium]|jgi:predicted dehydrogenase|nr:Gfo/Idh/MocA family oxidoreductase [Phycisphaerales bacterium]MBT7171820.1 Gfo/Idh/MocA family oxidoreductase [Phycisphaerales bacterium]